MYHIQKTRSLIKQYYIKRYYETKHRYKLKNLVGIKRVEIYSLIKKILIFNKMYLRNKVNKKCFQFVLITLFLSQ